MGFDMEKEECIIGAVESRGIGVLSKNHGSNHPTWDRKRCSFGCALSVTRYAKPLASRLDWRLGNGLFHGF
jgi:hypothetical protein